MSRLRVLSKLLAAAFQPTRPLIANLIVTRRCNLSCGYCFEYDKVSPPVPLETLKQRIDHLRRLNTVFVTLTGGETLLHPHAVELVAYVRERGMVPLLNTNGYLLTRSKIEALNDAGLFGLQISIDNLRPNDVTKKSLRPLLPKLRLLAQHAEFRVRVNSVLGSGSPQEAVEVAAAVVELGLDAKASLVRDEQGAFIRFDDETREAYEQIRALGKRTSSYLSEDAFQVPLVRDGRVDWKCRAGARFFHVCEEGKVHYCPSRHGNPGVRLEEYGEDDLRRAFETPKPCAPTCTQAYAHQASRLDAWRGQSGTPQRLLEGRRLPVIAA